MPEFDLVVEPVNFRFNGGPAENPVNYFVLSLELDGTGEVDGRFQVFVAASPGHQLHVSPNIGALRDGVALGIRMAFRA